MSTTSSVETGERTARASRRLGRGFASSVVLAAIASLTAAWKIGIWANHWYIAEQVYYPDMDEAAKEGPYWDITQLLRSGNEALLEGLWLLGVAIVFAAAAWLSRRSSRSAGN